MRLIRNWVKRSMRLMLPLSWRKGLCILLNRLPWLDADHRYWWSRELLADYRQRDANGFHRFLWAHHLGYALYYEPETRFRGEGPPGSRRLFFFDLEHCLGQAGLDPRADVRSVLEVGCSLGYQLRHLERSLFPGASHLVGIDIDRAAIEAGRHFLSRSDSKVELIEADMTELDRVLGERCFDVVLCTGVLMYLDEERAGRVVASILRHCRGIAGLSGPAEPSADNAHLAASTKRPFDGAFIHNLDRMVEAAGSRVLARRWEGDRVVDGHTIYFVFAAGLADRPARQVASGCES